MPDRFKYLLWPVLCLLHLAVNAQDLKSIGVPYIQNYQKSAYQAGNQNWSVTKDQNGVMYFGNAQGLLCYDGQSWQQYQMPNHQIIRSVAAANGLIYTGGFGEFGYWSAKDRILTYTSIRNLLPEHSVIKDEIWKIYTDKERVIFQSFSSIYIYQNGKVKAITSNSGMLFLHHAGDKFYAEVLEKGLFQLKNQQLIPLKNIGNFRPKNILSILSYKNGKLLVGTSKDGLFIYDGIQYTPLKTTANDFLKTYQLNNGVRVLDKYYAFGTILNGIIIIDESGNIIQRINKASGLQNNTVLSIYADDRQNLWAGLDNGVDRIELNAPLYSYFDKNGQFGTVYSSQIFQKKIYLGTNHGLFYSDWFGETSHSFHPLDFKLIPGTQGQVWDLHVIDGQLLCGHNQGTFRVTGSSVENISKASGGWTIKKLSSNPDYLIQGTYNGLVLFRKNVAGLWTYSHKLAGFTEPSRFVEQDPKGNIWVSHPYKGLYKLHLSSDFKAVTSTFVYNEKNGLPSDYNINVFPLENQLTFSSDQGFLHYDEISDRFTPYTSLNKALGGFASSNKIIPSENQKYWFVNHGRVALADLSVSGNLKMDSNTFSALDGKMVQYYENISKIKAGMSLISIDDGFVIFNSEGVASCKKPQLPEVLIRKFEDVTDTNRTISEKGLDGSGIEIPFNHNNVKLSYALPYYRQAKITFQYFLQGYSRHWSDWSPAAQKEFTNLKYGAYIFKVRAKINEELISKTTEFPFTILPPFYASTPAFILYVFALILLLFLGKLLYQQKLKKDKREILNNIEAEKEAYLKREAEANEKQIIKLQTEKLQGELAAKNREIANSAMSLVYKNELLQKLSQEILKIKDLSGRTLGEDQLRRIQKVIDEGMNDERDWNLFEASFNEAHESFFKKLKVNHPDLVPNDLKLCAYLHMNMSSKEMASLLNISLRGVEIRRYRLRKKLDVPHDKNLVEFLMEL